MFLPAGSQTNSRVVRATVEDLPAISALAGVIWRACYPGIITREQIDYMLARMYAIEIMRDEIRSQGIRYDRLLAEGKLIGFSSYGPAESPGLFKLHKLYLLPEWHGRGLGSLLLRHCESELSKAGARALTLNVNKRNDRAIAAYRRNGFAITDSVVADIGGGFVMDDYVMTKELARRTTGVMG